MAPGMKKVRTVPQKLCYDVWLDTGSLYKAVKVLRDQHQIFNQRTGKVLSTQTVWEAANTFLLENQEYARKRLSDVYRANGVLLDDEMWNRIVYEKAQHLSTKKLERFMDANPHLKIFRHTKLT